MNADGSNELRLDASDEIPDVIPDWGRAPAADLSITKADNADPIVQGSDITYTLTVANAGPDEATDVTLTDPLPIGTNLQAVASQGTCDISDSTVTCELGTLAAGASATVTITVTAVSAEVVTNHATVNAAEFDFDESDNADAESTTVLPASGSGEVAVSGHAHVDVNTNSGVDVGDVHVEANVLRDGAPSANPSGVIGFRDGRANPPGKAAKVAFECTSLDPTKAIVLAPNKVKVKGTVGGCTPGTPSSFKTFVATFTDLGANPSSSDAFVMKFLNKKKVVKYEGKFTTTLDMGDLTVTT
jgi:uncharacterized repeat protein (TIGR01451 family)